MARSALLLGLAGLALMAMFLVVLGVDPSDPYSELVAAARNPAAYRPASFLDMLVWVGIGGVQLPFAGYYAGWAQMRAVLLAACGAGQVVGVLGGRCDWTRSPSWAPATLPRRRTSSLPSDRSTSCWRRWCPRTTGSASGCTASGTC